MRRVTTEIDCDTVRTAFGDGWIPTGTVTHRVRRLAVSR
jgi:hypothetical protein